MLADVDHALKSFRVRIREDMIKVGRDALWPDCHGPTELLKPDLAPILSQWSRKKFEVPKNTKPLVQVEFDVLFDRSTEETATPSSAFPMSDWSTHSSARAEEEQVDMGVYLLE